MKKKKICIGSWKVSKDMLHWFGFWLVAAGVIVATAYGFSLSLRPNSFTLESAPEESLALVGVALANNLGTGIPRSNEIPVDLPGDVSAVQNAIIRDGVYWVGFFDDHFPRISEFTELVNLDVVAYLRLHEDRAWALENYIARLEEKKQETEASLAQLGQLHSLHTNALPALRQEIKNTQAAIEVAYNNRDGASIIRGLSQLEEFRIQEQEHRSTALFAERIGIEYRALIAAAAQKITVLQANTEPLIQGVTVKLPQGIDINALKALKIFATEENT
jgi:hypothetical protein